MFWFYTLLYLALLGYLLLLRYYIWHWERLPSYEPRSDFVPQLFLSVLVPARNEASCIGASIEALLGQDYPAHLYEIIVIDDESEDGTLAALAGYQDLRLRLFALADVPSTWQPNLRYKKRALAWGLEQARGDLIVCTDADAAPVSSSWLSTLAAFRQEHPQSACLAGPVLFCKEQSLWARCQSLDFLGMMLITAAGIASGTQRLGNGANLAYTPELFRAVSGFSGISQKASGDDILLLQKIAAKNPETIAFVKSAQALVSTPAEESFWTFVQQRLRWASKSQHYSDAWVQASLALVWFAMLLLFLAFLLLFWAFSWLKVLLFLLALGLKALADYPLLRRAAHFFGRSDLLRVFLPALFWHWLYVLSIGLLSFFPLRYTWKGRKLR